MAIFQVVEKFSDKFVYSAFKPEKFQTDNFVFRLHYKFTVWLIILYSACYCWLIGGNGISCLFAKTGLKKNDITKDIRKAVNDFCWVHGTYVATNAPEYGKDQSKSQLTE